MQLTVQLITQKTRYICFIIGIKCNEQQNWRESFTEITLKCIGSAKINKLTNTICIPSSWSLLTWHGWTTVNTN